jgi:hypothetical protein
VLAAEATSVDALFQMKEALIRWKRASSGSSADLNRDQFRPLSTSLFLAIQGFMARS